VNAVTRSRAKDRDQPEVARSVHFLGPLARVCTVACLGLDDDLPERFDRHRGDLYDHVGGLNLLRGEAAEKMDLGQASREINQDRR
jgi:hypothetical protein